MHPDSLSLLVCLGLLALAAWRISYDAQRLSDERCGRQGAETKARLLSVDNERLQAVIDEARLCPGQCFNRSVENFARELGKLADAVAPITTQRRRAAEENQSQGDGNCSGGTPAADVLPAGSKTATKDTKNGN